MQRIQKEGVSEFLTPMDTNFAENKKTKGLSLEYTTACGHVTWHMISGLWVPEAPGELREQESRTEFLSLVAVCPSRDLSLQAAL